MGLPPVKSKDTSGNVVNSATLNLEWPDGVITKSGIKTTIADTRNNLIKYGNAENGTTGWTSSSYRMTFSANTGTDVITFTDANYALPDWTAVKVWAVGGGALPGGLTTNTVYYYSGTKLYATSGATTAIDLTSSGTAPFYLTPMTPYQSGASYVMPSSAYNTTLSTQTSNVLSGTASYRLTKAAAVAAGDYVAYAFTISNSQKARVLQISFDYDFTDAQYGDGHYSVFVYDVTNKTLIQPAPSSILKGVDKWIGSFQTSYNSTSYELRIFQNYHVTIGTTADFDNVQVSDIVKVTGSYIGDWQIYTPTLTGFGTPSNIQFQWRRVGDSCEIQGKFTANSPTAIEARASLPSGLVSADTTKIPALMCVGDATYTAAAALAGYMLVEPSVSYLTFGVQYGSAAGLTKQTGSGALGSGNTMSFFARVPIAGWSTTQLLSSETATNVVALRASKNSGTLANATWTTVTGWTTDNDSNGMFDATNGIVTIKVPGFYRIQGNLGFTFNTVGTRYVRVQKNGVNAGHGMGVNANAVATCYLPFSVGTYCNVGDTLTVQGYQDAGGNLAFDTSVGANTLYVARESGPSQIAASECVSFFANTANQSIPASTNTTVICTNVLNNSHNAYSPVTGIFTVPSGGAGIYNFAGGAGTAQNGSGHTKSTLMYLNATQLAYGSVICGDTAGFQWSIPVSVNGVRLKDGDQVKIQAAQSSGSAINTNTTAGSCWFSGTRIGI